MARLVSPVVYSQNSAHCMTFWYHMSGSHVGTLRVKLRYQKPEEYDQLVWMAIGHQGDHWKEGRVLLHKSLKLYQVNPFPKVVRAAASGTLRSYFEGYEMRCWNHPRNYFRGFLNMRYCYNDDNLSSAFPSPRLQE